MADDMLIRIMYLNNSNMNPVTMHLLNVAEITVSSFGMILNLTMLIFIAILEDLRKLPGSKFVISVGISSLLTLSTVLFRSVTLATGVATEPPICTALSVLSDYFLTVTIFGRVCAAIDRFLFIRSALRYEYVMTKRVTFCFTILTWGLSLTLAVAETERHIRIGVSTDCHDMYDVGVVREMMTTMFVYGLPSLSIIVIYVTIFFYAFYQLQNLYARRPYFDCLQEQSATSETIQAAGTAYKKQEEHDKRIRLIPSALVNGAGYASFGFGTSLQITTSSKELESLWKALRAMKSDKKLQRDVDVLRHRPSTINSSSIRFMRNFRDALYHNTLSKQLGYFPPAENNLNANDSAIPHQTVEAPINAAGRPQSVLVCPLCQKNINRNPLPDTDAQRQVLSDRQQNAETPSGENTIPFVSNWFSCCQHAPNTNSTNETENNHVIADAPSETRGKSRVWFSIFHRISGTNARKGLSKSNGLTAKGERKRLSHLRFIFSRNKMDNATNRTNVHTPGRAPKASILQSREVQRDPMSSSCRQSSEVDRKQSSLDTLDDWPELPERDRSVKFDAGRAAASSFDSDENIPDVQEKFPSADSAKFGTCGCAGYKVATPGSAQSNFRLKVLRLIFIISLIIMCNVGLWIPFAIMHGNDVMTGKALDPIALRITNALGLLTNVFDPIIFGFMNIAFRQAVMRRFTSLVRRHRMMSTLPSSRKISTNNI